MLSRRSLPEAHVPFAETLPYSISLSLGLAQIRHVAAGFEICNLIATGQTMGQWEDRLPKTPSVAQRVPEISMLLRAHQDLQIFEL